MAILALITALVLAQRPSSPRFRLVRAAAASALVVLVIQIALGGWVSSNYAALACPDVPLCHGEVLPPMDFRNAFHVMRELGHTAQGELLSREALTAIHWSHRVFALVVVAVVGWAAYRTFALSGALAMVVAGLLLAQFSLGVANVVVSRPLTLAAAHNAVAALLLIALTVLNFFAFRGSTSPK
jgi:cytochrome c oxidase assembly protein subunit 15